MTGPASARDSRLHGLLALVLAAFGCWTCTPGPPGLRGVVLITIDTLRADHLGAYGGDRVATPQIDRLAADGTLFERAFTPMPLTRPAHASIFASLYPREHGVVNNALSLPEDFETDDSVVFIGSTEFLAFSNLRSATPHVLITPRGIVGYMEDTVPGGIAGWLEQRRAFDPKIIVTRPSEGSMPPEIAAWIREGRTPHPYKRWTVFAKNP